MKSATQVTFNEVIKNLRIFIELSLQEDERSWSEWIDTTTKKITTTCWEKMKCEELNCPAFKNECGRCWLIAGTMCGGDTQGKFAGKYKTCVACKVFKEVVDQGSANELQEHILILIHSLRSKHIELLEAINEIKTLKGIVPICMYCKKIRDEKGAWNQLEAYISKNTDAEFSHGICESCLREKYSDEI